jgi:hypothetical protein
MSRLVDFYGGQRTDAKGRFLKDIWTWEDDEFEEVHLPLTARQSKLTLNHLTLPGPLGAKKDRSPN